MTKILCAAGRRGPLGDQTEQNHNKRFSLRWIYETIQLKHLYIYNSNYKIEKLKKGLL